MAKQSPLDRARRLVRGCCPIHGGRLAQLGWIDEDAGLEGLACTRADCHIVVHLMPTGAPFLAPEWEHLLSLDPAEASDLRPIYPASYPPPPVHPDKLRAVPSPKPPRPAA